MESLLRMSATVMKNVGESLGMNNLDPESGMIFVTGGASVIGHRVAMKLLRAGYPAVRLGAMNPDSLGTMNKMGGEIATFAWDKQETYEKALHGVKTVLCTIPYTKNWADHFPAFLVACKRAGVKHFVKISFYHANLPGDLFQEVPLVRSHGRCDKTLMKSVAPQFSSVLQGDIDVSYDLESTKMSYTILYASHFMSNPFIFQGRELRESGTPGKFYGASANHGVNFVSPNDVAEVAVRVMLEPRAHHNKEYTLTGPEAINGQEVASLLSKYLKHPIMYVDQPLHEFSTEIKVSGDPGWMVEDLVALEKIKATGNEENVSFATSDIETLCGHNPETFEDYLQMTDLMISAELGAPGELRPLKIA